jgi:hypothetical protein
MIKASYKTLWILDKHLGTTGKEIKILPFIRKRILSESKPILVGNYFKYACCICNRNSYGN